MKRTSHPAMTSSLLLFRSTRIIMALNNTNKIRF